MLPLKILFRKGLPGFYLICLSILSLFSCSTTPGQHEPTVSGDVEQLPFVARVVNIPSDSIEMGRVALIIEVNYTDLQFLKTAYGYHAGLDYTLTITPEQGLEAKKVIDSSKEIKLSSFEQTVSRQGIVRIAESFDVPVGTYIVSILISDNNANSRGGLSHQIEVHDFISGLTISEPFLARDSVHTFTADKLIPLRKSNFDQDFFALVFVGGIDPAQMLSLGYELLDNRNEPVFERNLTIRPVNRSLLFSLPLPYKKLSVGSTTLKIVARHNEQTVASSLNIRANLGNHRRGDRNYTTLIGPMRYIMNKQEFEELQKATPEQQTALFNAYWQARDPDPDEESNPLLEEFYNRVEMANARFGWTGGEGYATDRGRTLVIYGPPDAVQNSRRAGSSTAYEIWSYYDTGRRFVFIDKYNDGNYLLLSDSGD